MIFDNVECDDLYARKLRFFSLRSISINTVVCESQVHTVFEPGE